MPFENPPLALRLVALLALLPPGVWCATKEEKDEKNCGNESLMACSTSINDASFSLISNKEDLDALCPSLHKGLRCIDEYTRKCLEPPQRSHFNKLYTSTTMVMQEICHEGPYQDEYLRHAPCMEEVKEKYEICVDEYQEKVKIMSSSNASGAHIASICCSLHKYLSCSKDAVLRTCGQETGKFAAGFLDKMTYSLMELHCKPYAAGPDACLGLNSSPSLGISFAAFLLSALLHFVPT